MNQNNVRLLGMVASGFVGKMPAAIFHQCQALVADPVRALLCHSSWKYSRHGLLWIFDSTVDCLHPPIFTCLNFASKMAGIILIVKWDFLFDFQTLCYCCFVILLLFLLLPSIFYIAFLGPFIPLIVLLQVKEKKSFSLTHYSNDTFLVQLYILGQRVKVLVVL